MKGIIMGCIFLVLVVVVGVGIYRNNQVPSGLGLEDIIKDNKIYTKDK